MPERSQPQRIPVSIGRVSKQPLPSPRRRSPAANRRLSKHHRSRRPVRILRRSKSEPNLLTVGIVVDQHERYVHRNLPVPDAAVLLRPRTCTDIFSSSESLPLLSPNKFEGGYRKDAKVVVNVTVEGSPGPIRTMVKLGSSVEETIRIVVKKYSEEGRSPVLLDKHAASSTFELHQSHFSLEGLCKSDVIGDVGTRSFYLRKGISSSDHIGSNKNGGGIMASVSFSSEIASPSTPSPPLLFFLTAIMRRGFRKLIRRTCKLWKILGCMHCT